MLTINDFNDFENRMIKAFIEIIPLYRVDITTDESFELYLQKNKEKTYLQLKEELELSILNYFLKEKYELFVKALKEN